VKDRKDPESSPILALDGMPGWTRDARSLTWHHDEHPLVLTAETGTGHRLVWAGSGLPDGGTVRVFWHDSDVSCDDTATYCVRFAQLLSRSAAPPARSMEVWVALQDWRRRACTLRDGALAAFTAGDDERAQQLRGVAGDADSLVELLRGLYNKLATPEAATRRDVTAPAPAPADTGFDKAPTRYMAQGRETVDRMRDRCREIVRDTLDAAGLDDFDPGSLTAALGDAIFAAACDTHTMKYEDRAGRKEGVPEERDMGAAGWWRQMAHHVRDPKRYPDPRAERPDFQLYTPYTPSAAHAFIAALAQAEAEAGVCEVETPEASSPDRAALAIYNRCALDLAAVLRVGRQALAQIEQSGHAPNAWVDALRKVMEQGNHVPRDSK